MPPWSRLNTAIRSHCSLNRRREFTLLLRSAVESSRGSLLDIGSGDGFWTERFARHFAGSCGLDPDLQALRVAQQIHGSRTQYQQGFAESLCFQDEAFDCVVSISCFEHFHSAQAALREAFRVLRPHGKIAISVDSLIPDNSSEQFRSWHSRKYCVTEYFSEQRLAAMLKEAGFEIEAHHTRHLISSPASRRIRELYLHHPRLLLALFPLLYLVALASDRWFSRFPGQIVVMSARKPRVDETGSHTTFDAMSAITSQV
jgi:ubiquinone/menaquinone biosynthesis C-methylase UbiE